MSAVPTRLTAAQYLAWGREAEGKGEFVNGEVFAMAGATPIHALITANVVSMLQPLKKMPCRVYAADLRVGVQSPSKSPRCTTFLSHETQLALSTGRANRTTVGCSTARRAT